MKTQYNHLVALISKIGVKNVWERENKIAMSLRSSIFFNSNANSNTLELGNQNVVNNLLA